MTERVRVDLGDRGYDIVVGAGAIDELASVLADRRRVAIVSQDVIVQLSANRVQDPLQRAGIDNKLFTIADGEAAKTLDTVQQLSRGFAQWGLLRSDAVVAFGGGLVGDTAGFAASVYYRGVDVVQVPTTLLAMVDAAIGGKTGVNLPEGKNLVGAFHQPRAVLIDPALLRTLPDREFRCGLGEVVKYALLGDDELATLLDDRADALLARDPAVLTEVIARCVRAKAAVVAADELERTGSRAALNLGHTAGHAIERAADYALERIPPRAVTRADTLVRKLGLPVCVPPGLRADELLELMARDKKSEGTLTFVLPGPNGIERVDDPDRAAIDKAFAAIGVTT